MNSDEIDTLQVSFSIHLKLSLEIISGKYGITTWLVLGNIIIKMLLNYMDGEILLSDNPIKVSLIQNAICSAKCITCSNFNSKIVSVFVVMNIIFNSKAATY